MQLGFAAPHFENHLDISNIFKRFLRPETLKKALAVQAP